MSPRRHDLLDPEGTRVVRSPAKEAAVSLKDWISRVFGGSKEPSPPAPEPYERPTPIEPPAPPAPEAEQEPYPIEPPGPIEPTGPVERD